MIIWLASYPKSGNTWVRSFISAYYYSEDGKFDFNLLSKIKQFPSNDFFDKKMLSVEEAANNWIKAQRKIIDLKKVHFLKTHNVYGAYKGNMFTTPELSLGAIYIIRDPRNVITSLMNHFSINENNAIQMISNAYRNLRDENDDDNYANYSFISSWNNNYNSWKLSKQLDVLFVKYEELENNTIFTFKKIVSFINKLTGEKKDIDIKKLKTSIETTAFDVLKEREEKEGFSEAIFSKKDKNKRTFFYLGSKNNYKFLLKKKTSNYIEKIFYKEMKELGYL